MTTSSTRGWRLVLALALTCVVAAYVAGGALADPAGRPLHLAAPQAAILHTPEIQSGLAAATTPVVTLPTSSSSAFNWGDAGIGAAAALALLIGVGATAAVVRRRTPIAH